jgi:tetratricopeptide (TPR) repeat protein
VFRGRVHELAEQYFQERNLPIQVLDAVIHHYGKTDPERERAKQQEYTRMAIREAKGNPSDPFAHYNVVQQALLVDDWSAVLSAGEAFLALESKVPMMIYLGMAKALVNLGRPEESLKYLEVMLRQKPNHAVALEAKGESLWRLGRIAEAQDCFLKAIDCEPSFSLSFLHLARMLDELNLAEDARRVLEAGLDQNPKDEVLWGELVGLSARHKDARVAADAWDALSAVPRGGQGLWHQLVVCTLLDKAAKEDAARVMDLGLKAFPGHSELQALKAKAGL